MPLTVAGGAGVVVFFLVSGYIIAHVLQTEAARQFLLKRFFRGVLFGDGCIARGRAHVTLQAISALGASLNGSAVEAHSSYTVEALGKSKGIWVRPLGKSKGIWVKDRGSV